MVINSDHNTHRPMSEICDSARWTGELPSLRERYAANQPYPHVVLDDFLAPEIYAAALREFPGTDRAEWTNYFHVNEHKRANVDPATWAPTLRMIAEVLTGDEFLAWVSALSGFDDLVADWSMDGGGLHQCLTGGFLNVHADFTAHHRVHTWRRRVNLLLYLNEEWRPEWNGELELWSADMARCDATVMPLGNRVLLFTTEVDAFHGHPTPLECPDGVARQSMALYFFSEEDHPIRNSTDYRARPGDGWRSAMIYLDKVALRGYDVVKRRVKISDRAVSRIMQLFRR